MVATSQNGWPVLSDGSAKLHDWVVPTETGEVRLTLRSGPAGFVLCHYVLWHAELIEPVAGAGDDFGFARRKIAGSDEWSNHASGTAVDVNASKHPSGQSTFTSLQVAQIRARLEMAYPELRWGGDFRTSIDEMHFEVNASRSAMKTRAVFLLDTWRGVRLAKANPGQVTV